MFDLNGREYARVDSLKAGDIIEVDGDFTCAAAASIFEVKKDYLGRLYFECSERSHLLDGQKEDNYYIGIYPR